jgi:hypothetical protein
VGADGVAAPAGVTGDTDDVALEHALDAATLAARTNINERKMALSG